MERNTSSQYVDEFDVDRRGTLAVLARTARGFYVFGTYSSCQAQIPSSSREALSRQPARYRRDPRPCTTLCARRSVSHLSFVLTGGTKNPGNVFGKQTIRHICEGAEERPGSVTVCQGLSGKAPAVIRCVPCMRVCGSLN